MQEKKKFKTTMIVMSVVACIFLLVGIIQTFVLNSQKSTLDDLKDTNAELGIEQQQLEEIHDYMCQIEGEHDIEQCLIDNNYLEEYWKLNHGYGEDGDKIIQ